MSTREVAKLEKLIGCDLITVPMLELSYFRAPFIIVGLPVTLFSA